MAATDLTTFAGHGPRAKPESERFWPKVDVRGDDECWEWTASARSAGYGSFRIGSLTDGTREQIGAHRWVCINVLGMDPALYALHKCDNRLCCNPRHLYGGTAKQNAADAVARNRVSRQSCPGEKNPNAKLTEADVISIRRSTNPARKVAAEFGVSATHVAWIRDGRSWGHINGA